MGSRLDIYNWPPVCLSWGRKKRALSKGLVHTLLYSVPLTLQQATVYPHLCQILLDNYRQVWVNLLSGHCSFLLVRVCKGFVSFLQESVSPLLWKFCNQIPLTFKAKFPGGFSVHLPDPRVGKFVVGPRNFATV